MRRQQQNLPNYSIGPYEGGRGPYLIIGDTKGQGQTKSFRADLDPMDRNDEMNNQVYIQETQQTPSHFGVRSEVMQQQPRYGTPANQVSYGNHQYRSTSGYQKQPQFAPQTQNGPNPNYCFNCGHSYKEEEAVKPFKYGSPVQKQRLGPVPSYSNQGVGYRYAAKMEFDAVDDEYESQAPPPPTAPYYRRSEPRMTEVKMNQNQSSVGNFSIGAYEQESRSNASNGHSNGHWN